MGEDAVSRMLAQAGGDGAAVSPPPLAQWNPPLSGDMDLVIDREGRWFHEGVEMRREGLVRLFASILRHEDGVGHVLVTPVEKWRIRVADAAFVAVAVARRQRDAGQVAFCFATNVGDEVCAGPEHALEVVSRDGAITPYLFVRDGLRARLSRPVFYQLADFAEQRNGCYGITSDGVFFPLQ